MVSDTVTGGVLQLTGGVFGGEGLFIVLLLLQLGLAETGADGGQQVGGWVKVATGRPLASGATVPTADVVHADGHRAVRSALHLRRRMGKLAVGFRSLTTAAQKFTTNLQSRRVKR